MGAADRLERSAAPVARALPMRMSPTQLHRRSALGVVLTLIFALLGAAPAVAHPRQHAETTGTVFGPTIAGIEPSKAPEGEVAHGSVPPPPPAASTSATPSPVADPAPVPAAVDTPEPTPAPVAAAPTPAPTPDATPEPAPSVPEDPTSAPTAPGSLSPAAPATAAAPSAPETPTAPTPSTTAQPISAPDTQHQSAVQVADTEQEATAAAGPDRSVAVNQDATHQQIWQLQVGCLSFCLATTQRQTAGQHAYTQQTAQATGTAIDVATVIQDIVQLQIGCLLSCEATSQEQVASQDVMIGQRAKVVARRSAPRPATSTPVLEAAMLAAALRTALADAMTVVIAGTQSTIAQHIVQAQLGCLSDCRDVRSTQAAVQAADADQRTTAAGLDLDVDALTGWLLGLMSPTTAANSAQTDQSIAQTQVATCLSRCTSTSQVQEALQSATTIQRAVLRLGKRHRPHRRGGRIAA